MLKTLYNEQCLLPMPHIHELDFSDFNKNKVCPYLTDCEISGTIHSYIHAIENNKVIQIETYHNLEESRNNLEKILKTSDDYTYEYFYNWYTLSKLVLNEIEKNPSILSC
jgi:hypothetical protein